MANYILVAPQSNTNGTTEIILERDEDGNVTKKISTAISAELSDSDRKKIEDLGYKVEAASEKSEAPKVSQADSDVSGAAPVFGTQGDEPDQRVKQDNKQEVSKGR